MAIAHIDTDGVLGAIALRVNSSTMSASIGYWLTPEARGHGYTTMALRLVCGWLFENCDLGRIELTTGLSPNEWCKSFVRLVVRRANLFVENSRPR